MLKLLPVGRSSADFDGLFIDSFSCSCALGQVILSLAHRTQVVVQSPHFHFIIPH